MNSRLSLFKNLPTTMEGVAQDGPQYPTEEERTYEVLENPYKPGFIDNTTPETLKIGIDYELNKISNSFFTVTERGEDFLKRTELLEIQSENTRAAIKEEWLVRASSDEALAQRILTLTAEMGDTNAKITEEQLARVTADEALASSITKLEADYKAADSVISASVVSESQARASADSAIASSVTQLETKTDNGFSSVNQSLSTVNSAITGIQNKWAVTLDANGNVAGVELINGTNTKSAFTVRADKFQFVDTGGTTSGGFTSSGGVTAFQGRVVADSGTFNGTVNANSGVFNNVTINDNCTINATAKIGTAQVETLMIQGNAVTVPGFAQTRPNLTVPAGTSYQNVGCEFSGIYFNQPGNVTLIAYVTAIASGNTNVSVSFTANDSNNTVIHSSGFNASALDGFTSTHVFTTNFNIGYAGQFAFQLRLGNTWGSGSYVCSIANLLLIGTKR